MFFLNTISLNISLLLNIIIFDRKSSFLFLVFVKKTFTRFQVKKTNNIKIEKTVEISNIKTKMKLVFSFKNKKTNTKKIFFSYFSFDFLQNVQIVNKN